MSEPTLLCGEWTIVVDGKPKPVWTIQRGGQRQPPDDDTPVWAGPDRRSGQDRRVQMDRRDKRAGGRRFRLADRRK